jgi:hypothetical protein
MYLLCGADVCPMLGENPVFWDEWITCILGRVDYLYSGQDEVPTSCAGRSTLSWTGWKACILIILGRVLLQFLYPGWGTLFPVWADHLYPLQGGILISCARWSTCILGWDQYLYPVLGGVPIFCILG